MNLNLRLIHAKDFLQMTPTGEIDLETSKRFLLKFALENGSPSQYDVLVVSDRQKVKEFGPQSE